jgi:hypothetical protein
VFVEFILFPWIIHEPLHPILIHAGEYPDKKSSIVSGSSIEPAGLKMELSCKPASSGKKEKLFCRIFTPLFLLL